MPDDIFSQLDRKLAAARAQAEVPELPPKSFFQRAPEGPSETQRQNEFNLSMVEALRDALTAGREHLSKIEERLQKIESQLGALHSLSDRIEKTLAQSEANLASAAQSQTELAGARNEQRTAIEELRDEQRDLLRNLLEEQRVSIKQLALRASEEAVLADRTRRATEQRLEEFARQLEAPRA